MASRIWIGIGLPCLFPGRLLKNCLFTLRGCTITTGPIPRHLDPAPVAGGGEKGPTNSMGDNQNTLNEAATGFRYNVNKTSSFEARYQVFKFNDDRGVEDFDDDYFGQGMSFAFKKALG